MFVIVGVMTLAMLVLFAVVIRDHPSEHPWLSENEKAEVRDAFSQSLTAPDSHGDSPASLPFRERMAILTGVPAFWLLCVAAFFGVGVYFTAMSWFPGYLVKERGFTIMSSGIYLIIPYLAAFAGMYVAGGLGDRGYRRSLISLVTAILTFPALVAMGMSEGVTATITFMSVALFLNSAAVNGFVVLVFDLIPAQVFGTAIGIVGGLCGGLGGVLGPLLLGYLYDKTGTFFWGFVSLGVGAVIGGLVLIPVLGYERQRKQDKTTAQPFVGSPAVATARH